jgi:hypothetical protein
VHLIPSEPGPTDEKRTDDEAALACWNPKLETNHRTTATKKAILTRLRML